jgi:gliding motility-associated-like protein
MSNPTTMLIDGSVGASTVNYYVNNLGSFNGPTTPITFTEEGTYEVIQVVSTVAGCSDTSYGQVIVIGNTEVFIPNAFTPNNDELNTHFKVYGIGFTNFHMTIYNRWGELLFETYDENIGWDGTYGGRQAPSEVYIYKVELNDFRNALQSYLGSFTLIR